MRAVIVKTLPTFIRLPAPRRRIIVPRRRWWRPRWQSRAMASGDFLLTADGGFMLDPDGNFILDDGSSDCCCDPTPPTYPPTITACDDGNYNIEITFFDIDYAATGFTSGPMTVDLSIPLSGSYIMTPVIGSPGNWRYFGAGMEVTNFGVSTTTIEIRTAGGGVLAIAGPGDGTGPLMFECAQISCPPFILREDSSIDSAAFDSDIIGIGGYAWQRLVAP